MEGLRVEGVLGLVQGRRFFWGFLSYFSGACVCVFLFFLFLGFWGSLGFRVEGFLGFRVQGRRVLGFRVRGRRVFGV